MAETPSKMIPLGTKAPDFCLQDTVTQNQVCLRDAASKTATVIAFICNHCPYVKLILDKLVAVAKIYQTKGINFLAISSNDVEHYPLDSPQKMQEVAAKHKFTFPYLYDESQAVAKSYGAACTPDFFIFDSKLMLVYRGRFDDARPGNGLDVTGRDLSNALDNILKSQPLTDKQYPSLGCNIKWRRE